MEVDPSVLYDNLTGLPTRACFFDRLMCAIAYAKRYYTRFAVFALGLDGFNAINESLGYDVGDQLLKQVGKRLQASVRQSDTTARLGGDEFVMLLNCIHDTNDLSLIANHVLRCFDEPFDVNGDKVYIHASIGIACHPEDGACPESLMLDAYKALSNAKAHGKNHFELYNAKMSHDNVNYLMLSNDLHRALDKDEFVLHFQPIVDIQQAVVVGVEALVRWQHPVLGLLGPNEFIPIAEKQGLIQPLSDWVMRNACSQLQTWQKLTDNVITMSVNISAHLFEDPTFSNKVKAIIEQTQIDAHTLNLEITENTIMHNPESAVKTLKELSALKVKLSIDDFGTGYSSLSYLRNFPVDTLKVDRSFVHDMEDNEVNITIIKSILMLAEALNIRPVVEGVETETQKRMLQDIGCRYIQGFLFSKALPAEACLNFINHFHLSN